MPTLKCAGTGHDLDCTVGDTPLTCDRIAENVLVCKDEDGDIQAIIGPRIQPSSPASTNETKDSLGTGVTSELESIFDDLIVELYNNLKNGSSNVDALRVAFEVITEIARTDPDLALEKIGDIRSYAIESNSIDTQSNCDLFSEIITYVKDPTDPTYSLDHAIYLAGQNNITIDPQDPLTGLSEKLYRTFFTAVDGYAFEQGLTLIAPAGIAKGFDNLDSYINQLLTPLTPSGEEE